MDLKGRWEKFYSSGKVEDYLIYKIKERASINETDFSSGISDKGDGRR